MNIFMFNFKILTILFIIEYGFCQQQSTITAITGQQIKNIGDSVELNCTVQNNHSDTVVWTKRERDRTTNSVTLSIRGNLTFTDERFKLVFDNNTQTYSLQIKDIRTTDTGIYECQIILSVVNKVTSNVELLIRYPPKIYENVTIVPNPVHEGQSAELKCDSDGYPRPRITWSREYDGIMPAGGHILNGRVMKINLVSKQDRGLYYCNAANDVGIPDKKLVKFEVEFAPYISVPRPKVAQALNYDIEMECKIEAYPAPSILWYKGTQQILNNDEYSVSNIASEDEITSSILYIRSVGTDHYGDYFCKASNKIGHAEARLNLYGQDSPNINYAGLLWNSSVRYEFSYTILILLIFLSFLT